MAEDAYKVMGAEGHANLGSIDLTGLTDGRVGVVPQGSVASLTEEEAKELRGEGLKLKKLSAEEVKKHESDQQSATEGILNRRGADQTHAEAVVSAREAQEAAQQTSGTTTPRQRQSGPGDGDKSSDDKS